MAAWRVRFGGEKDGEFHFGNVDFEMSVRNPSENVEEGSCMSGVKRGSGWS